MCYMIPAHCSLFTKTWLSDVWTQSRGSNISPQKIQKYLYWSIQIIDTTNLETSSLQLGCKIMRIEVYHNWKKVGWESLTPTISIEADKSHAAAPITYQFCTELGLSWIAEVCHIIVLLRWIKMGSAIV